MKFVPPSIDKTAFNCPHCGVLTTQFWYSVHADPYKENSHPHLLGAEQIQILRDRDIEDQDQKARMIAWAEKCAVGRPFLEKDDEYCSFTLSNVAIGHCYNCKEVSIWMYGNLIYPNKGKAPLINPDTPKNVRTDYEEASSILDLSPRGAAALLRLAVQKLCIHLEQPGKNLNDDIAALVEAGLSKQVQQALDVVRVIGNEAVHPGQIDLNDNRATAETLFRLLNLIVEKTISEPNHVKEVYEALPEAKRKAIEDRDGQRKEQ